MLSLTQKVYQTLEIQGEPSYKRFSEAFSNGLINTAKRFIWNSPHSPVGDDTIVHTFYSPPCLARQTTQGNHDPDIPQSESVPPIHRIPVEVLGEIFSRYLEEPADHFSRYANQSSVKATMWFKYGPLLLGHICAYWRMISLSMPTLWSSIAISKPTSSQIPFIQVWLDRAEGCSLSLGILQSEEPDDMEQKTTNDILSLFLTRAHLWRRIDFRLHQNIPNPQLRNLPATPVLESVHLRMQDWDRTFVDEVWRKLHLLPSLRQVEWDYLYMEKEMPAHAPWAQLTHINMCPGVLNGLCLENFLDALRQCQELVSFETSIIISPSDSLYRGLPVTLPKLRILQLDIRGGAAPSPLFQHLVLPSLVSLELYQEICDPVHRLRWVKDFISRSGCHLENFFLWDSGLKEDDLANFLISPEAQHLARLELKAWHCITDQTIKLLTCSEAGMKCFLPHLEVLIVTNCPTSEGVLYKMITSRLPVLKTVQICFPRDIPTQDLLSLKSLLSSGRNLKLQFGQDMVVI
ncbi:hypothetical protein Hypma_008620 [Hypsizygus marmoreus]|uniref:F-box domain-containing protein n=1 Tax=Hypsizygus marmoreus TaxID=39966 RepID=A0A369JPS3_HYPMA|nr:hypothetical protein Hypma_008620 [Hypsizygus marmoreus]